MIGLNRRARQLKRLEKSMEQASNVSQWRSLASEHDQLSGAQAWKGSTDNDMFDARQISRRYLRLKEHCDAGNTVEVLFALNEGIHGNMGGMGKASLYRQSKLGTKDLIESYVNQLDIALQQVADAPDTIIAFDDKLDFFRRASHCFGRSALALSGGSGLIYFHHGVVQSLFEADLLPHVISGSSAGAWMCAQIGTRNDEELKDYFLSKRYEFTNTLTTKGLFDIMSGKNREQVQQGRDEVIDAFVGDQTFQEAYEHTGRYINISVAPFETHQTSRLLNAITSPNVTIRSAVRASSSVPGMVEPAQLEAKDSNGRIKPYLPNRLWVDGSFSEDLPFKRMSRLFGVNHFIVSMVNPAAVPFLKEDPKTAPDSLKKSIRSLYYLGVKETIKTARRWSSPGIRNQADTLLGLVYRLMDQDYSGDINIVMKTAQMRARHINFAFKDEAEIKDLIRAGQQTTWPKLDQIKNATLVSRVVDGILSELEQEAVASEHAIHRTHRVL